jgi:hypothetical protein
MMGELVRVLFIVFAFGVSIWLMNQSPAPTVAPPTAAEICQQFPELTGDRCRDISSGVVWRGMTDDMATLAWGVPDRVERSFGPWGVHERWIYEKSVRDRLTYQSHDGGEGADATVFLEPRTSRFLFFENRVLTHWQDWTPSS